MLKVVLSVFAILTLSMVLSGCGSHPVLPQKDDIKVSRDTPSSSCKSLGLVEGRTKKISGTTEDALDDLKGEAIKKGANYVKMEMMGALGTSIRGEAFFCE